MRLNLIRNATLKLDYGGTTLLVDPDLAARHARPSFIGRSPNPMVGLPMSVEAVLADVEHVIVSHLHADHFDAVAKEAVPKTLPLICQPGDEEAIMAAGFESVTPLAEPLRLGDARLTPQPGRHGTGEVLQKMGTVTGFSLEAAGEPSLYWCGDSVLYPDLLAAVAAAKPDIIVTHSCGALWDGTLIVMDAAQTLDLCEAAPHAVIVAVHMEALDHATVTRAELRAAADARRVAPDRLLIPADGERLEFGRQSA